LCESHAKRCGTKDKIMPLTIDVPIELEQKLEAEAKRRGLGKDELVRVVLEENLNQSAW
jgi:predicted DNA-binding protein